MREVQIPATAGRPPCGTHKMGTALVRAAIFAGMIILLSDCSSFDIHSVLPQLPNQTTAPTWRPDPEPDTVQLVRANIDYIFSPQAHAQNISVTPPRRASDGSGWTACVKANITSIGGSLVTQHTYLVFIHGGHIEDRRAASPENRCSSETYQALYR